MLIKGKGKVPCEGCFHSETSAGIHGSNAANGLKRPYAAQQLLHSRTSMYTYHTHVVAPSDRGRSYAGSMLTTIQKCACSSDTRT